MVGWFGSAAAVGGNATRRAGMPCGRPLPASAVSCPSLRPPSACLPPGPPCSPQGDFLDQAAELILKQFKEVGRGDVYAMEGKKKVPCFDDGTQEDEA